jgi:hypothetical protein
MFASGMMGEPGFATAGYSLFWVFNRVELVCAGVILTSVLSLRYNRHPWNRPGLVPILLSGLLLIITCLDTYAFTPAMSSLGLRLDWFSPLSALPDGMGPLHIGYWLLELLKVGAIGWLIWLHNRAAAPVTEL